MHLLSFHSTEQVKVHLEEYFHKSQLAWGELDQNLCLLCIQCFEVSNACEEYGEPMWK